MSLLLQEPDNCYFCAMWFQLPTAVLQLQKKAGCQFITQPNLAFPRTRTELQPCVYKLNKNPNRTEPW